MCVCIPNLLTALKLYKINYESSQYVLWTCAILLSFSAFINQLLSVYSHTNKLYTVQLNPPKQLQRHLLSYGDTTDSGDLEFALSTMEKQCAFLKCDTYDFPSSFLPPKDTGLHTKPTHNARSHSLWCCTIHKTVH